MLSPCFIILIDIIVYINIFCIGIWNRFVQTLYSLQCIDSDLVLPTQFRH